MRFFGLQKKYVTGKKRITGQYCIVVSGTIIYDRVREKSALQENRVMELAVNKLDSNWNEKVTGMGQ